ncbi:hypothetical protein FACS189451_04830 [Bacteroidia bacterium]|nr:hypothetical protein FACS189451_04830 [Bacteroidia bacterium]
MATVTLNYNANNTLIKSIIHSAVLAGASVVEEKSTKKKLTPFEESLEDIKHGRVTRIKNIDNIIEELLQ